MGALYRLFETDSSDNYSALTTCLKRVGIQRYIETGTGIGDGIRTALSLQFPFITSIEMDSDLGNEAGKNFPEAQVHTGLSVEILKNLDLSDPAFYFLDAHFPFADFGKMSYEKSIRQYGRSAFPLEDELGIISKSPSFDNSIIVIDDAFLYCGDNFTEWSRSNPFKYRELAKECGISLDQSTILEFLSKHSLLFDYRDQGYIIALPK